MSISCGPSARNTFGISGSVGLGQSRNSQNLGFRVDLLQKAASGNLQVILRTREMQTVPQTSKNGGPQNGTNFNHSHVDFLGSPLHAERRRMHSPTKLPTKSEAACCTARVFNTGAMWISMLCAGLLTPIGCSSENIALLCVFFALHCLACFLAFAFAWGPALKILL